MDIAPFEFTALGFILGMVLGCLGIYLWRHFPAKNLAHSAPGRGRFRLKSPSHTISCLMCGRRNKVSPQEWEKCKTTCRCGQPLYLAASDSAHEHHRRF
jgi:hypothetical protein